MVEAGHEGDHVVRGEIIRGLKNRSRPCSRGDRREVLAARQDVEVGAALDERCHDVGPEHGRHYDAEELEQHHRDPAQSQRDLASAWSPRRGWRAATSRQAVGAVEEVDPDRAG